VGVIHPFECAALNLLQKQKLIAVQGV